eukprot:4360779-Pleurochrysis_carterae.AAC.1
MGRERAALAQGPPSSRRDHRYAVSLDQSRCAAPRAASTRAFAHKHALAISHSRVYALTHMHMRMRAGVRMHVCVHNLFLCVAFTAKPFRR